MSAISFNGASLSAAESRGVSRIGGLFPRILLTRIYFFVSCPLSISEISPGHVAYFNEFVESRG
jgi:hypothetical protein